MNKRTTAPNRRGMTDLLAILGGIAAILLAGMLHSSTGLVILPMGIFAAGGTCALWGLVTNHQRHQRR